MNKVLAIVLMLVGTATAEPTCTVKIVEFSWQDTLGNTRQGLKPENLKWLLKALRKKYPEVCYEPGGTFSTQQASIVLSTGSTPATYHGTRTVRHTQQAPITGTINSNEEGQVGTIEGTQTITTEKEVPYSVPYEIGTMTLSVLQKDGTLKAMHRFQHDTLSNTMYGFRVSNRHPAQHLIEEALKWIHAGGLTDATQGVQ